MRFVGVDNQRRLSLIIDSYNVASLIKGNFMDNSQQNNAKHVERIMRERGYELWEGSNHQKLQKSSSKGTFVKMILFIILPLSLIFVPLIISDHIANVAREKEVQEEQLSACLALASNDYWVSKEEENLAGSDPDLNLILAKRRKAGIEAKIKCHEDVDNVDKNAIYTLEANKNEIESWISVYESEISDRKESQDSQSTYCTSQQYGTSIYTNCY